MWWGTLGTIRPFPDFDPNVDARSIQKALDKKGAFTQYHVACNTMDIYHC